MTNFRCLTKTVTLVSLLPTYILNVCLNPAEVCYRYTAPFAVLVSINALQGW